MTLRLSFIVRVAALAALGIALVIESLQFVDHAILLFRTPVFDDGALYFSMGRAWLNGLSFYRDVFETKPPLVFLLSALSLTITGNNFVYAVIQLLVLALFGPALAIFSFRSTGKWPLAGVSLLLGLTLATRTLHYAEGYQPEGFALLFATLPTLILARPQKNLDIYAGIFLGVAAMLKEPFGIAGCVAMFVFCHSYSDALRILKICAVASVTSIIILVVAKALPAYFTLYLPEILSGRSIGTGTFTDYVARERYIIPDPLWARSLNALEIFPLLASPLQNIFLAAVVFLSVCLWIPLRAKDMRVRSVICSVLLLSTLLYAAHNLYFISELVVGLHSYGKTVPWGDPLMLQLLSLACLLPFAVTAAISVVVKHFRICLYGYAAAICLVLCAALVSFGSASLTQKYLIFAFPVFTAFVMYCLVESCIQRRAMLFLGVCSLIVANALMPGRYEYAALLQHIVPQIQSSLAEEKQAPDVDAILTRCNEARYLLWDGTDNNTIAAFTRHSPYQLLWGFIRSFPQTGSEASPNPYLANKMMNDLQDTPIIIVPDKTDLASIPRPISAAIAKHFTTTPPSCARGIVPIAGLKIFFRSS